MGSGFGLYILSIAGAVVLMTFADIIMPEGQTAKYIKSTLSIFLVLIILSPIADFFSGGVDLSGFSANSTVQTDYGFINKLNARKAEALEEKNGKLFK
jgi:Stage III sporulation protein AF (Spore_III_AF).